MVLWWQLMLYRFRKSSIFFKLSCGLFLLFVGVIYTQKIVLSLVDPNLQNLKKYRHSPAEALALETMFQNKSFVDIGMKRIVHLDLKGAPPILEYLKELLPLLKLWGANGLLIEYEDTFPYWGPDFSVIGSSGPDSPGVYTRHEIKEILSLAAQNELEVIPLVQTFGHFEFVLKHDAFRHLREISSFPSSLCPSNPNSLPLVQALLTQILELHPGIQTLHIGADEVWHLGVCNACQERMSGMGTGNDQISRDRLFLQHVTSVLNWLKSNNPSLHLLMWDDMLRHMDPSLLQDLWSKYSTVFSNLWIASAFKGASGSNALLPNISQHLECQERWMQELRTEQEKGTSLNIRGVAITGWSRYDHYAVMCELLPVSIPSLALCLKHWKTGAFTQELHAQVSQLLNYPKDQLIPLAPPPLHGYLAQSQSFPGWEVKGGMDYLADILSRIDSVLNSEQMRTWMNPYYMHMAYSNPARIIGLRRRLRRLLTELSSVERTLKHALPKVFTPHTVEEWFGTVLEPRKDSLRSLLQEVQRQISVGGRIRGYQYQQ